MADSFTQFGMTFIFFGFAFIVTAIVVWVSKQVTQITTIPYQTTDVNITGKLDALKGDVEASFVDLIAEGVELPDKDATSKMELVFTNFDLSEGGVQYNALTKIQFIFDDEFVNLVSATVNGTLLTKEEGQLTTDLDVSELNLYSLQDSPVIVQLVFGDGATHSLSEITSINFRTDSDGEEYFHLHELVGPDQVLSGACDAQETVTYYSSVGILEVGSAIFIDSLLTDPAQDGYYAGLESRVLYYILGGQIEAIGGCPTFLHELTGPEETLSGACDSQQSQNFYSSVETLQEGSTIFTDFSLTTPAQDGYYAGVTSRVTYYIQGGEGVIDSIDGCPVLEVDLTGPEETLSGACDAQQSQSFYSAFDLQAGGTIFTDALLTTPAQNGYYAGITGTYYTINDGVGTIESIDSCPVDPPVERFQHQLCYGDEIDCPTFLIYYSTAETLYAGAFLFLTDVGNTPVTSGYYMNFSFNTRYNVNGVGEIVEIVEIV